LMVFILLGATYLFRKIVNRAKSWIVVHRYLTTLTIILLVVHIVDVGGIIGYTNFRYALEREFLSDGKLISKAGTIVTPITEVKPVIVTPSESPSATAPAPVAPNQVATITAIITPSKPIVVTPPVVNTPGSSDAPVVVTPTVPQPITPQNPIPEPTVPVLPKGPYTDGTYYATAVGYSPGLKVKVVIENGNICAVEVVSHNEIGSKYYSTPIAKIPVAIVAAQSTKVDVISGATLTSVGIIKAVDLALADASK
ncbi:MAG: FMN-binding protein, partial [bacterium]|nr:FMN-binding protein [bacterium]